MHLILWDEILVFSKLVFKSEMLALWFGSCKNEILYFWVQNFNFTTEFVFFFFIEMLFFGPKIYDFIGIFSFKDTDDQILNFW